MLSLMSRAVSFESDKKGSQKTFSPLTVAGCARGRGASERLLGVFQSRLWCQGHHGITWTEECDCANPHCHISMFNAIS